MQEELEQRTVSITVQSAKLSGRVLKAAIAAAMRKMEQERGTPKVGRNSLKRLAGRDGGMNSIEVSGRLRSFEQYARKHQVRYHIEKEVGSDPPKWTVYFKANQADALKEYTKKDLAREGRPSLVATYLLTNCFNIVMAVFDLAQNVVSNSAGIISGSLNVSAALSSLRSQLGSLGMWELIGVWLETNIINLCMWVLSIVIFVIVYGRMIEIYLTVSLAPIPFSTMANREWGAMGQNYLRSLFALAFQGFLILVCIAIYAVLVQSIPSASNIHAAIWGTAGYTVLLAFALFKTGSLSKSVFNAH